MSVIFLLSGEDVSEASEVRSASLTLDSDPMLPGEWMYAGISMLSSSFCSSMKFVASHGM